jgi:hypothetical protein
VRARRNKLDSHVPAYHVGAVVGGVVAGHPLLRGQPGGVAVLGNHLPVGVHRHPGVGFQLHVVGLGLKLNFFLRKNFNLEKNIPFRIFDVVYFF